MFEDVASLLAPEESFSRTVPFSFNACLDADRTIHLRTWFDEDLYPASFAQLMCQRFVHVLALNPGHQPLPYYPTPVRELSPHVLFEQQTCFTPDATAIDHNGTIISYAELNHRASELAATIAQRLGSGRDWGTIAVACGDGSVEGYVGIIATQKFGCPYVPIDPSTPVARMEQIFAEADVSICITEAGIQLPEVEHIIITAERDDSHPEATRDLPLFTGSGKKENPVCCVMYTSGSTGTPKGIVLGVESVISSLFAHVQLSSLSPSDRVLSVAPLIFDIHLIDLWMTLAFGATVCPVARDTEFSDLAGAVARLRPTRLFCTPTVLSLLDASQKGTLRVVWLGGEPVPERLRRAWMEEVELTNVYGPTECGTTVTAMRMRPSDGETYPRLTVGFPHRSTVCLLVDERGDVIDEAGRVGEVWITGKQLGRGYLKKSKLTETSFVPHPLVSGDRAYRTGDLAYRLPTGELVYDGRKDHQVKIRGQRIELDEIAAAFVAASPGSEACAVVQNTAFGQTLIVFVQLAAPIEPTAGESDMFLLRNALGRTLVNEVRKSLPSYAVPSHVVAIRKLPVGGSGKRDRKLLTAIDLAQAVVLQDEVNTSARSSTDPDVDVDVDRRVRSIIEDVSGLQHLISDRSLFENGMTSFQVIQLPSKLTREFGRTITIQDVMTASTVGSLSALVSGKLAGALADFVDDDEDLLDDTEALMTVSSTSKLPGSVFIVHDLTGHSASLAHLTTYVQHNATLMNDPRLGFATGFDSFAAMATKYNELILPNIKEPLVLVGFSFGAPLALEMAAQLRKAGRSVHRVLLLDGYAVHPSDHLTWSTRCETVVTMMLPHFPPAMRDMVRQESERNMRNLVYHTPATYRGPVTLIKAGKRTDAELWGKHQNSDDNGWTEWIPDLTVIPFPGSHVEIVNPTYAERVAAMIDACFDAEGSIDRTAPTKEEKDADVDDVAKPSDFEQEILNHVAMPTELPPARIVCVHASGSTSALMEKEMTIMATKMEDVAEFIYLDGPHDHVGSGRAWTPPPSSPSSPLGDVEERRQLRKSALNLYSRIRSLGFIDGVLGVGQGAVVISEMDDLATRGVIARTWRIVVLVHPEGGHKNQREGGLTDCLSLHVRRGDVRTRTCEERYLEEKRTVVLVDEEDGVFECGTDGEDNVFMRAMRKCLAS
ncbi:hypothetical protein HKX48_000390 [Thoreauomyces humboldtii]|nr:hypothetical protein HKX48_000390 [Thoreauomyces humboldtii]